MLTTRNADVSHRRACPTQFSASLVSANAGGSPSNCRQLAWTGQYLGGNMNRLFDIIRLARHRQQPRAVIGERFLPAAEAHSSLARYISDRAEEY